MLFQSQSCVHLGLTVLSWLKCVQVQPGSVLHNLFLQESFPLLNVHGSPSKCSTGSVLHDVCIFPRDHLSVFLFPTSRFAPVATSKCSTGSVFHDVCIFPATIFLFSTSWRPSSPVATSAHRFLQQSFPFLNVHGSPSKCSTGSELHIPFMCPTLHRLPWPGI